MNKESNFQIVLPKPLLTLWVTAIGLKIWLKTLILLLSASLFKGIQGAYRLLVSGDWALVSVSISNNEALKYLSGSALIKATENKSGYLASVRASKNGFKGTQLFNSTSWGINPCRHDNLYTLKTKLL